MTTRLTDSVDDAARTLLAGGVVAVPTETVYGLGADVSNENAIERVFEVKGRPRNHPLIVHVADIEHARQCSSSWTPLAEVLGRAFWPGPLSILTEKSDFVPSSVSGGLSTVVVRIPRNAKTLRLIELLHDDGSVGLAAPSANRFGSVSPTSAQHVLDDLDGDVDAILDDGPCDVGVESTIVDCRASSAVVLRPGGVTAEAIAIVLAQHGLELSEPASMTAGSIAPGMLVSHYATRARIEVHESLEQLESSRTAAESVGRRCCVLPHPDDPYEYSKRLYAMMRECDATSPDLILALLPSAEGMGLAVRDRLLKASAER